MSSDSDRLHVLYEVNRRLATFVSLDDLVRYATRRVREVLDAAGCALLLVDHARGEFYFPVASQSESHPTAAERLAEIRFPADRGIAGWVLARDQAVAVPDAAKDPRFYDGVDRVTSMSTRAVLCAPLRTRGGNIGVISVINPAHETTPAEDLEFLEALASDVAVAYEKTLLYARLRGEVIGLRQACTVAGIGLVGLGAAFALGTLSAHLAWALPWRELPSRPGMLTGVGFLGVGAALLAVARGWLVGRTPESAA